MEPTPETRRDWSWLADTYWYVPSPFCALGVNRSPAVAAGYLCLRRGFSLERALQKIVQRRPFVSIHEKYLSQLASLKPLDR